MTPRRCFAASSFMASPRSRKKGLVKVSRDTPNCGVLSAARPGKADRARQRASKPRTRLDVMTTVDGPSAQLCRAEGGGVANCQLPNANCQLPPLPQLEIGNRQLAIESPP